MKTLLIMSGTTILILAGLAFLYLKGKQAAPTDTNTAPVITKISGTIYNTGGGIALRAVLVTVTENDIVVDRANTSSFGKYEIPNLQAGKTYTVTPTYKRYRFAPVTLTLNAGDNVLDFTGIE